MNETIIFWMVATLIWIVAIWISIWQSSLSKQQLDQSKETKRETEKLLDDIKLKITEIKIISDETRKDVKDQISKMIDKNDENFKTLLNSWKEIDQNQLMNAILPWMMQNPDWMSQLMELAKLGNNKK